MSKKEKPKPKHYYDIFDLIEYLGVKHISDIIPQDQISSDGCLVMLYYDISTDNTKQEKNIKKLQNEFGEIEVKVWW